MAYASPAMALASPTKYLAIPKLRDTHDISGTANYEKAANALLTASASPAHDPALFPPAINVDHEMDVRDTAVDVRDTAVDRDEDGLHGVGMPLSKGALSDLDGSATITPRMLAKHHLPGIILGNGPRPIRHVMGELTQNVPGFSRIPPAKARRIVVAALESRSGGGVDGNIEFCKTGWGRWDAHVKGSSRDSGIGSFNEGHLSPPRSEHSSYAMSYNDSAIHMPTPSKYIEHYSGGSWSASSIREEDELDIYMDPQEEAADKMSLDGVSEDSTMDDETDDDDWAAVGVEALRKASSLRSGLPRQNYRALSVPYNGRFARQSSANHRPAYSTSVPSGHNISTTLQTPEEKAAVAALISMGSM